MYCTVWRYPTTGRPPQASRHHWGADRFALKCVAIQLSQTMLADKHLFQMHTPAWFADYVLWEPICICISNIPIKFKTHCSQLHYYFTIVIIIARKCASYFVEKLAPNLRSKCVVYLIYGWCDEVKCHQMKMLMAALKTRTLGMHPRSTLFPFQHAAAAQVCFQCEWKQQRIHVFLSEKETSTSTTSKLKTKLCF